MWRKVLWLIFIVFGVLYSAKNVGLNTERYFSYPSQTKPAVASGPEGVVRFPKVTACLNNMHSLVAIRQKYPFVEEYLPLLYGQTYEAGTAEILQQKLKNDTRIAGIDMAKFYRHTMPKCK